MKKLVVVLVVAISVFVGPIKAQNSSLWGSKKCTLFVRTIIFEGNASFPLENNKFIKKIDDPQLFNEIAKNKYTNCICADTVIFSHKPNSWEKKIIVKVHSNLTTMPLFFEGNGHLGVSFRSILTSLEWNFYSIKSTMRRQEAAAVKGDLNYDTIE